MERVDFVILAATPGELAPLSEFSRSSISTTQEVVLARDERDLRIAGNPFSIFTYRDRKLLVGTTGIGKVNAAATAAAALSNFRAAEVWNVGCAGAYAASELEIGDVLITENCICADEGILSKDGPTPTSGLGIPLVIKGGQPLHDCFPLNESLSSRQTRAIIPAGMYGPVPSGGLRQGDPLGAAEGSIRFKVRYGPSLTVGMVSGDIQTAGERFRRFKALAENMEGSAIAQTCLLFDVPFLEFRGISNIAGVRDKSRWDLRAAAEHCLAVIVRLLDNRPGTEV